MAILTAMLAGCATSGERATEPANLYPHKLEVRAYVESGQYLRDIASVANRANAWLEQRSARRTGAERLAVVFDLDETLLLNWPYLSRNDFGYLPAEWVKWVEEANAPAVEPVRAVYQTARRLGLDVIFITGRTENQRAASERNVRAIGCGDFVALLCKPVGAKGTSAAFKSAARERMTKEGWTIIANLGDQQSDLVGGFSERTFKLPNPFYLAE